MKKQQSEKLQLRYYDIPKTSYVLDLLSESSIQYYGHEMNLHHFHNALEIGFCHSGDGEIIFKEDTIPYFKNEFTIIPPNYPHTIIEQNKSSWDYLFIDLEGLVSSTYPNNLRLRSILLDRIYSNALLLTHDAYPRIGNLILEIIRESREKEEFYLEAIKSYLLTLVFELARIQSGSSKMPEPLLHEHFAQIGNAITYMETHYHENIKTSTLAEVCNLSETHFRRLFLKKINYTPQDYLIRIRIHVACRLLQDETVSIEEAALKCGYISMSTFNRNFKKVMHQTPKEWRQNGSLHTVNITNYSKY